MRDGHRGVDAGGIESRVAEELLDDSDVGPVFVHVGGATVPQEVAASGLGDPCGFDRFGDSVAEVAGAEPFAVSAEKEGLLAHFEEEFRAGAFEVFLQPMKRSFSDGKEAVFVPFSFSDEEGLAGRIEVAEVQVGEFASPRAGGVEGFQHGAVPDSERVANVGNIHEVGQFVFAEPLGQAALFFAGKIEVGGGVGGEVVAFAEVGKEALDCAKARPLGSHRERFAVRFSVSEKPALEALQDGLGDLGRAAEVELF
jgi:hypothetical protein